VGGPSGVTLRGRSMWPSFPRRVTTRWLGVTVVDLETRIVFASAGEEAMRSARSRSFVRLSRALLRSTLKASSVLTPSARARTPLACSTAILEPSAFSSWATRSSRKALESCRRSFEAQQRVLTLVEVDQERVDPLGVQPRTHRVEQVHEQRTVLA
jgi:hypothetical protein